MYPIWTHSAYFPQKIPAESTFRSYQSRPCSLPSPYLLLVYRQGLGREQVGRRSEFGRIMGACLGCRKVAVFRHFLKKEVCSCVLIPD